MKTNPKKQQSISSKAADLAKKSSIFYIAMAAVGLLVCHYSHNNLIDILKFSSPDYNSLELLSLGGLGFGVLVISKYLFEDYFPAFKAMRGFMTQFMGALPLPVLLYVGILSAVAEEFLFRAAIQPAAGLIVTSFLFSLLHLGPTGKIGSWSFWALLAGLIFGWTFQETGSLWPALIAHVAINIFSLTRMKREYLKMNAVATSAESLEESPSESKKTSSGSGRS